MLRFLALHKRSAEVFKTQMMFSLARRRRVRAGRRWPASSGAYSTLTWTCGVCCLISCVSTRARYASLPRMMTFLSGSACRLLAIRHCSGMIGDDYLIVSFLTPFFLSLIRFFPRFSFACKVGLCEAKAGPSSRGLLPASHKFKLYSFPIHNLHRKAPAR